MTAYVLNKTLAGNYELIEVIDICQKSEMSNVIECLKNHGKGEITNIYSENSDKYFLNDPDNIHNYYGLPTAYNIDRIMITMDEKYRNYRIGEIRG